METFDGSNRAEAGMEKEEISMMDAANELSAELGENETAANPEEALKIFVHGAEVLNGKREA